MRPRVSVVMPVYERPELINNAINSIIDQTYKDWELIVVDDGSEEDIEFHVKEFEDERIKYFKTEHKGLVHARNFGYEKAEGEWILVQDSDDLSMPDRIEKLMEWVDEYDIVYSGMYMNVWSAIHECITRLYIPALPVDKEKLLINQYIPGIAFFKKYVWEQKPLRYETQFCYDWMMWLDWVYSDYRIKALDLGLYEYVKQENSISIQFENDGRRKQSIDKIREIMKKEYGVELDRDAK